jgi:hypothetical protein
LTFTTVRELRDARAPYYLDYKKRGLEYALTKWSETLPKQKVKVKIIPNI